LHAYKACRRARDLGRIHTLLPLVRHSASEKARLDDPLLGGDGERFALCSRRRRRETRRAAAVVFAEEVSSLADAGRSCGVGSWEPGADAHIQPQSVSGLRQTPKANLLPPVSLVALNLLLGHAQVLAELRLRKAVGYTRLGEEFSQRV
jgi:hypothetical protein